MTQLREVIALSRRMERHLASELEVNATDLFAMEHLSRHGTSTPSELAHELGVTSSAATFVVDRLAAQGHVTRQRHPDDRRKTVVAPAAESVRQVAGLIRPLAIGLADYVDSMPPADRVVVEAFLDHVAAAYRSAVQGDPTQPADQGPAQPAGTDSAASPGTDPAPSDTHSTRPSDDSGGRGATSPPSAG